MSSAQEASLSFVPSKDVEGLGLQAIPVEGAASLPERLRHSHAEIRQGTSMTRSRFKQSLKELEDGPEEP